MPRRRGLTPEQLGHKGESRFEELCNDAGLTRNKSVIDVMGWDYLVECPYPISDNATPLDKRPHPFECKVQVKTIWDDTNHVSLTLSAAERLSKARLPSFIVVLTVDAKKNFTAIYVFHMLDQHLEHVLSRLRRATATGSLKINHIELSFKIATGVRLQPDGDALREFLVNAVGHDTSAYFEKKQDQLANLGFGPLRYEGKFTFKAKNETEVTELFLGLRSVEVTAFQANEIRFGIKLPDYFAQSGRISITPHPFANCKLIARSGRASASVTGKLYLPAHRPLTGNIPFRIATTLLEVIVNGTDITIDFKPDAFLATFATTAELLSTLKFHRFVAEGGGQLTIFAKGRQMWQCEVPIKVNEEERARANRQIRIVEMAASVLKAANGLNRLITFGSIADKLLDLIFLADLIGEGKNVRVNPITIETHALAELPPISDAILIKQVCFPDFSIAYYAVIDVTLSSQPPNIIIQVGSVSLRDIAIIDRNDEAFDSYVEEAQLTSGITMSLVFREITQLADKLESP